jgi:hypothetical protein
VAFKRAYFSFRAVVLGLLEACARGLQELHKDPKISALHPPSDW